MSLVDRTRIVLVSPRFPENIGSVARAMHNLGFKSLTIVDAPGLKDSVPAQRLAVDAAHILDAAREVEDFEQARIGLVFGTTAHDAYETWTLLDPVVAANLAIAQNGPISLVFGGERYGMSKALLRRCDQIVHLPTAQADSSLNLAQAVLVLAWEWRRAAERAIPSKVISGDVLLPDLELDWAGLLEEAGFLKPHNREKKMATLRQVLSRVRLSPEEAAALQGVGSKLALLLSRVLQSDTWWSKRTKN